MKPKSKKNLCEKHRARGSAAYLDCSACMRVGLSKPATDKLKKLFPIIFSEKPE